MTSDFIATNDPRWERALENAAHDVYALPQYARAMDLWEQGSATAFYAEENGSILLVPLIRRSLPRPAEPGCDLISPYGYPSLVVNGKDEWLARALRAFREASADAGAVTALLRLHPLLPLSSTVLAPFGELVSHGPTVYIDLTRTEARLQSETRPRLRSHIRRLQRLGFEVTLDDWDAYDEFIGAYHSTIDRLAAAPYYRFTKSFFYKFRDEMKSHLHFCRVIAPTGELAGAGLFTSRGGILQYHLSASVERHRSIGPSKLMIHFIRMWGQRTGHRALHLGGGVGGMEDSLFQFKSGFAPTRGVFRTMRMIFDVRTYLKLTADCAEECGASSFFPPYRAFLTQSPALCEGAERLCNSAL